MRLDLSSSPQRLDFVGLLLEAVTNYELSPNAQSLQWLLAVFQDKKEFESGMPYRSDADKTFEVRNETRRNAMHGLFEDKELQISVLEELFKEDPDWIQNNVCWWTLRDDKNEIEHFLSDLKKGAYKKVEWIRISPKGRKLPLRRIGKEVEYPALTPPAELHFAKMIRQASHDQRTFHNRYMYPSSNTLESEMLRVNDPDGQVAVREAWRGDLSDETKAFMTAYCKPFTFCELCVLRSMWNDVARPRVMGGVVLQNNPPSRQSIREIAANRS